MVGVLLRRRKKALSYFRNHIDYNATIHFIGGIGIGILIASPLAFPHPVRWAFVFLMISVAGHFYAATTKGK
jgi:hypothetical protein